MMKKYYFYILAMALLLGKAVSANPVTPQEAARIAETFWQHRYGSQASMVEAQSSAAYAGLYIFNNVKADGFVIVAADDRVIPILGYSDQQAAGATVPVNVDAWLRNYSNAVVYCVDNDIEATAEISSQWGRLREGAPLDDPDRPHNTVAALLTTTWSQSPRYNNLCPYDATAQTNTITGCVATAMAQIMKYWEKPIVGVSSKTYTDPTYGSLSANFGNTYYAWSHMPNALTGSSTQAQIDAVATLMYHCGVAVETNYGLGASGAPTISYGYSNYPCAENAFKNYFDYKSTLAGYMRSDYTDAAWLSMITAELNAGRPVLYSGSGNGGGHAFVCDGYDNQNYFHMNWGWGGYCNGFYALNALNPDNRSYSSNQDAIIGIEPNSSDLRVTPNNLSFSGLGWADSVYVRSSNIISSGWTASCNETWLTVSPLSGSGSGQQTVMYVSAPQNTTENDRTAYVVITQGSQVDTLVVYQPAGATSATGWYGRQSGNWRMTLNESNEIIVQPETLGNFPAGSILSQVKFFTSNVTGYTNNSFTIKVYEGSSLNASFNSGISTSQVDECLGTLVRSQQYTQSSVGEQVVTLSQPYTAGNRPFWITVQPAGASAIMFEPRWINDTMSVNDYLPTDSIYGSYLYTYISGGTRFMQRPYGSTYTNGEQTEVQLYNIDYCLSFYITTPQQYTVTAQGSNAAYGSVTGGGSYASGSTATLTATPNCGYQFTQWNDGNTDNPRSITVNSDTTFTAQFAVYNTNGAETDTACDSYTWINNGTTNTYTTSGTYTNSYTAANGCPGVDTLHLTVKHSSTGNDVQTACDTYTWIDGNTYTASNNTATDTLTNVQGCDSVVTLNLTINNSNAGVDLQTACDSLTWIDGIKYTASNNTATVTLTNTSGCDSVVTLNLTVNNSSTGVDVLTACDTYTWLDGITYTVSNSTATYTLTNAAGCDSVVTLNLTMRQNTNSSETHTVCDIMDWNGTAYTASGVYTYAYTNDGCTGTDTLHLTVNYSSSDTDTYDVCDAFTWTAGNGNSYTENNAVDTVRRVNSAGCDSIVYLNLTVRRSTAYTDMQTSCDSLVWIDGITYFVDNSTATDTLVNDAGCDSVVTLNLTVSHGSVVTDVQNTCDSYMWIDGVTYTDNNNTATVTLANMAGCDSVVTLSLTVNHSSIATDVHDVCDSLTWYNGTLYTADNNTDTLHRINAEGCDSLVTLNLTVRHGSAYADVHDVCDSLLWYGTLYTASNTTDTVHLTNANGCDSVVTLNLTVRHSSTYTDVYHECDSMVWLSGNGLTYTSGNNTDTVHRINMAGCDSLVTLDLTLNYSDTVTVIDTTACGALAWNGMVLTADSTFFFSYTNAGGCDSLCQVNLTIQSATLHTTVDTACGSYVWAVDSVVYTESTSVTVDTAECTDVYVLQLTVNPVYTDVSDSVTACGSYAWLGHTFTATSDSTALLTTAAGCDSTVNFHVTIYVDSSSAYSVTDTDSYTWVNHGNSNTYTQSGTYTNSYTTADGCASVDTLHLTVISSVTYYTVTVHTSNARSGYASVDGDSRVEEGRSCTVRASAYSGYRFVRWNNGYTANPYTFTVTQDTMLVAVFESASYTVTVVNGNPGRGTVTGSCTARYGLRRNISARAANGYRFSRWDDGDTNANRTITVTGNITLTAYFDVLQFHVDVLSGDSTQGTVSGGGNYDYMAYATLQAVPANGYCFDHWSDGDTTNPRRVMVLRDTTFTAYFTQGQRRYTLTVTSANETMGRVSGGGLYERGTATTITATANSGYEFVQWTDGVTANPRTVTVISDTTFTATFRAVAVPTSYTVSVSVNDSQLGSASGSGTYRAGTQVQLNAYPAARCHFMRWSDGNTANPRSITVDSDISLTAIFARDSVMITVRANDEQMGTVTGGGFYPVNATVTITATANSGYRFVSWSTGETANPHSFTVRYAFTYTAIFEPLESPEGIESADNAAVRVWGSSRTIYIAGLSGETVRVYDVTGRTVSERAGANGDIAITVDNPGLYVVQTGTATHKVMLR